MWPQTQDPLDVGDPRSMSHALRPTARARDAHPLLCSEEGGLAPSGVCRPGSGRMCAGGRPRAARLCSVKERSPLEFSREEAKR